MNIRTIIRNNTSIALVQSDEPIIIDIQSSLDLMATVKYETGCNRMALNKEAISEDFFNLSTRLAGEILQKFINYHMKFAIIGDFSIYSSKPLKDFIYESNHGKDVFFVSTVDEAIDKLASAQ
ncbi:DUF4180 domain-containing protein [Tissierella sp. MSJ-40]|uniref:DUF4180 domain-containing protein n=1 Tax=Tissierella simiarum TaxID=2841534 RepID=A0ABS6E9F1_9FIRM|nr:DUF4180 domain-containing protein [Tissierella simiarum]MBU5439562.1 DUF4180 domain-containing protein [Tissierella simiarum]